MADDKKGKDKFEKLEDANKGYNELYGKFQDTSEEVNVLKKELAETKKQEDERRRQLELMRQRQTQARPQGFTLTEEEKVSRNKDFIERMRNDPYGTIQETISRNLQRKRLVSKDDLTKQQDFDRIEQDKFKSFIAKHSKEKINYDTVKSKFSEEWDKLPAEQRNSNSFELLFQAAKGQYIEENMNPEKMKEEVIKELRDKTALGSGKSIPESTKSKSEKEKDDKAVDDIADAYRGGKVKYF